MHLTIPMSASLKIIIYKSRQPEKQEDTHLVSGQCPSCSQGQVCPQQLTHSSPSPAVPTTHQGGCHTARNLSLLSDCSNTNSPSAQRQRRCSAGWWSLPSTGAAGVTPSLTQGIPNPLEVAVQHQRFCPWGHPGGCHSDLVASRSNVWVCPHPHSLLCAGFSSATFTCTFNTPTCSRRKTAAHGTTGMNTPNTSTRQIHHREQAWILHLLGKKNTYPVETHNSQIPSVSTNCK